jgi:DNA-binding NtrC family response regulator
MPLMTISPETEHTSRGTTVVLSVSPNDEDHGCLERIFREADWPQRRESERTLVASNSIASSISLLRKRPVPVVLCESDLSPGTWQEMLEHISLLPDAPLLIVTSRLADERLWAEALNLGAYDVLVKPFDTTEVVRVVSLAWQHWQARRFPNSNGRRS